VATAGFVFDQLFLPLLLSHAYKDKDEDGHSVRGGGTEHLVEANTCSLVVKGAESPRLMHDPEAVPPMQHVDFSRVQEPTYCRTI
jgi:hypothetical protein